MENDAGVVHSADSLEPSNPVGSPSSPGIPLQGLAINRPEASDVSELHVQGVPNPLKRHAVDTGGGTNQKVSYKRSYGPKDRGSHLNTNVPVMIPSSSPTGHLTTLHKIRQRFGGRLKKKSANVLDASKERGMSGTDPSHSRPVAHTSSNLHGGPGDFGFRFPNDSFPADISEDDSEYTTDEESMSELLLQPQTRLITAEQLDSEVGGIYRGLCMVEEKAIEVDREQRLRPSHVALQIEQYQSKSFVPGTLSPDVEIS